MTFSPIDYALHYGSGCRDCADADGTCPTHGLPCNPKVFRAVVEHTLKAWTYGIEHGFMENPFSSPGKDGGQEVENLDVLLKAAGMYTVAEMMGVTPLTRWNVHAGMNNLDFFGEWLDRKVSEYLRMKAGYELGDKDKGDELYEWVLAHAGAFSTIRENFRAAREGDAQPASTALVERLTDKQLRDIADSKDTATCRARLLAALSASTSREGER